MKKVIAIDIDDVIADSTESLRVLVNSRANAALTPEDYKVPGGYWGYYENVWRAHGIHDLISFEGLNAEMEIDQSHVPVMVHAERVLRVLAKQYDLISITARDERWRVATEEWLERMFKGSLSNLYFTGSRRDGSYKDKGMLCRELGASYLIDDNIDHCQAAINCNVTALLFGSYGWHSNRSMPQGLVRVNNWQEVKEFFDAEARK